MRPIPIPTGPRTNLSDPSMQALVKRLKPFDRTAEVLASAGFPTTLEKQGIAADISGAVNIPRTTPVEHDSARFEIQEVNGHVVYYVELLRDVTPDHFREVVKTALGPLWGSPSTPVEIWLEAEGTTKSGPVVGIWIRNITLDAMNRAYFTTKIPREIASNL